MRINRTADVTSVWIFPLNPKATNKQQGKQKACRDLFSSLSARPWQPTRRRRSKGYDRGNPGTRRQRGCRDGIANFPPEWLNITYPKLGASRVADDAKPDCNIPGFGCAMFLRNHCAGSGDVCLLPA